MDGIGSKYRGMEIEDETVRLLVSGMARRDVHKTIAAKYGIKRRRRDCYMKRAQEKLRELTGKTRDQHVRESLQRYYQILEEADRACDKIAACTRIDKLLGLEAPQIMNHQVDGEVSLRVEFVNDDWATQKRMTLADIGNSQN